MKKKTMGFLFCTVALLAGALAAAPQNKQAEIDLEDARRTLTLSRDLKTAIAQYESIAAKYGSDPAVVARALMGIANCYQASADPREQTVLQRIVREYPRQPEAAKAQARLVSAAVSTDLPKPKLVCRDCGGSNYRRDASITPDGILVMKDNGGGNVEVRDLSKGSRGEVKVWQIFGQGGVHIPGSLLISPDGKQIAGSGMIGLSVMPNAAHSSSTLVKNGGRGEPGNGNPVGWSPDGTSLLIVGGRGAARGFRWLNIDDGLIRELGDFGPVDMEDGGPSLSPDGQFVAYSLRRTRETRQSPIYTATVNGSGKTPVVTPLVTDGLNSDPIWTPDGRRVLFIRESQGTAELWAVGVRDGKAAGAPSLILKNLGGIPVGITRDGVFYYAKQLPGSNRWVTVDMEAGGARIRGSALHVIGSLEGVPDGEANISPNGEFMVYNRGSLVIYSMETSKERVLDGVRGFRIAWLHDSSGFMQWRSDAGGSSLYRVDVASGNSTKLLHDDHPLGTSRPIAVSPDDKTVYSSLPNTTTNGSDIVAFNLSTGQVRTVHPNAEIIGYDIALAVSHDGRTLALNLRNGIARVGVDGTGFQALVSRTSELQSFSKAAWTADDQNILFAAELVDPLAGPTVARQQNSRIMRVAAAGGRPESTGIDVEGEIRSISLSGNGSRLVYALRNPESSEIWSIDLSSVLQQ